MSEVDYYDNPEHWTVEQYLADELEKRRFEVTAAMIPDDVRTLVDVGAGNGIFLSLLEPNGGYRRLMGVERSPVAIANKACRSEILQGSIEVLPLGDRGFDLVSCLQVIEHLPKNIFQKGVEELARASARYILVSVPFQERRARVDCPFCGCSFNPNYHLQTFDVEKVAKAFPSFRVKDVRFVDETHRPLWDLAAKVVKTVTGKNARPGFPAHTICPQCGHAEDAPKAVRSSAPVRVEDPKSLKVRIRSLVPSKQVHRWVIVLLERAGTSG